MCQTFTGQKLPRTRDWQTATGCETQLRNISLTLNDDIHSGCVSLIRNPLICRLLPDLVTDDLTLQVLIIYYTCLITLNYYVHFVH